MILPSTAFVQDVEEKRGDPVFDSDSRLLLIAPHPDDETLGCGIVLQRAVRAGAAIHVVYATDGDNNPWPQRWIDKKWRLNASDRERWGKLRRAEALAALKVLGVSACDVQFLGLPDQGLTDLLLHGCSSTRQQLAAIINGWSPTHLLIPSAADTHPDHNALAVMLRIVLSELVPDHSRICILPYAIHGQSRAFLNCAEQDRSARRPDSSRGEQTHAETATKIRAILCHATQLRLSRRRFLRYASRPERLVPLTSHPDSATLDRAVRSISRTIHGLQFQSFLHRPRHILLCGHDHSESFRCVALKCPKGAGQLRIPTDIFSTAHSLFIKIPRRPLWFFDKEGWIEVPALPAQESVPKFAMQTSAATSAVAGSTGRGRGSLRGSWPWAILFVAVVAWLGAALSDNITKPWIGTLDYNGAVWSQSAHNILRAGLVETSGASSGFYFGPLPIPAWGYYLHHPPLLHLVITALFYFFGEHEWVARLLPISCSLLSVIFLWFLVRSCAGIRAATLAAAVFGCLPMELRYGKMVNFEPVVLMLILGALLCLRYWKLSGKRLWQHGAFALILAGLWVDWAMHIFVVSLCLCWLVRSRHTRRFAIVLLATATLSAIIYLIRIQMLQPDAWQNLAHTLVVRLGASGHDKFTELQWCQRIFESLLTHFLLLGWILAIIGAFVTFRARNRNENLRWLGRACLSVFVMDALFVGIFQNDSYIHQYIAFYFLAPVAIMAGIALDRFITLFRNAFPTLELARIGEVFACVVLLVMGIHGGLQTKQLQGQFYILDHATVEPPNLIPELGDAIQKHFPPGTHVLCNFLPEYGPHLAYYAQRDILNNLSEYRFWHGYLQDPSKTVGGVVWMTPKASHDLIAQLPPGSKQFFNVGNQSFCLWKRDQPPSQAKAGTL